MTNNEIRNKYPFLIISEEGTWLDMLPPGWNNIVLDLCEKIKPFVDESFEIYDMKEKWCQLRIYHSSNDSRVEQLVNEAEKESSKICGNCGNPLENPGDYICSKCMNEINKQYKETK